MDKRERPARRQIARHKYVQLECIYCGDILESIVPESWWSTSREPCPAWVDVDKLDGQG